MGINTNAPDRPLSIVTGGEAGEEWLSLMNSNGVAKWHLNHKNGGLNFVETLVADFRLFLAPGGNVGIGTNSPTHKLHVNGSVAGVGAYNWTSPESEYS